MLHPPVTRTGYIKFWFLVVVVVVVGHVSYPAYCPTLKNESILIFK